MNETLESSRILRRRDKSLEEGLASDGPSSGKGHGGRGWRHELRRMRLAGKPHLPSPAATGGPAVAPRRPRRR